MDRRKPFGASGALAAQLISPRNFDYYICPGCMRDLYHTFVGEDCPHCGARVTSDHYVEGELPNGKNLRASSRAAEVGRGGRRRGGRRRPAPYASAAAG
jgi:predicted amidophosphoribosyltransferase